MSAGTGTGEEKKPVGRPPAKAVLGKGLASLIPQATIATAGDGASAGQRPEATGSDLMPNKDRHPGIMMSALEDIVPNVYQPRHQFDDVTIEELAQSIRENGLIQPLIVRRAAKGFQLIAGERRFRAAKLAGLKQVPIVIRRTTDQEALELALIENIQREDLNCIDTAAAYQQLMTEFGLTQEEMAKKVGKDRATVANHLRLLRLPQAVVRWLKDSALTYGHGKALAGLEDAALIERLAAKVIDDRWSVRQLEAEIQSIKGGQQGTAEAEPVVPQTPVQLRMKNLSKELSQRWSTKVVLKGNENKGKIILEYYSSEDLNRLLDGLQNK
jgi:ParB family chromosome partitioning protein